MSTPGPDRDPEHEMEQQAPGDEPRIEIGEDPPYGDPSENPDAAREGTSSDEDTLADLAPDQPGEDFKPTDPDR